MNKIYNISHVLLLTAILLLTAACSSDSSNDVQPSPTPNTSQEISLIPTVWQMAEATRATMLDNTYLQNNGFRCTAYDAGTNNVNGSANIDGNHVRWENSRWNFDGGTRNWPASGDLDFFAYTPTTIPSYIKDTSQEPVSGAITYNARVVQFQCENLDQAEMTEFVYALTTEQNKTNAANGVTLTFLRPFTRIVIKLAANHPAIQINTITFKSIQKSGSYNNGTWTPSGAATDLVWNINTSYPSQAEARVINDSYLVIPQTWEGVIEVNATWNVWGESKTNTVSKDLEGTITWQRGYSYTYTFNITETDLVVNTSKYTEQW
ncbi:MAG: fimbrillin family protein [Prevotella sp.]|nr:fimbrillin family protein [Prevotella sp.]